MACTTSVMQQCSKCLSETCFAHANILQAASGYRHALGRKMRFESLISCNAFRLFTRSKHKSAGKLFQVGDGCDRLRWLDRSRIFHKVSAVMFHDGIEDFLEGDHFDVSLARKLFPCIVVGHSHPVELYDGISDSPDESEFLTADICDKLISSSIGANLIDPDTLHDTWNSEANEVNQSSSSKSEVKSDADSMTSAWPLTTSQDGRSSSVVEETSNTLPSHAASRTSEKSSSQFAVSDLSSRVAVEDKPDTTPFEFILDKPISCIPGLSKKRCSQLENCGFHTIRKLLNHYPRTYADLQNAQFGIDDGQYLIFVGKVLSSRGIKAGPSAFSFLEVVVVCEIAESASASEINSGSKRTIYLHLKKFFRGKRFTYPAFLRSIEAKHKEGDIVCVSGKVRTMRAKDHYEMRQYNMDLVPDQDDESACGEERPYPIYPSKGGLDPKLLQDIISRVLGSLPHNIDPIPKNILQEFGLKGLYDAYLGIHQPRNFTEADLARRRLIFDEFFYLQLARLFQLLEGLGTWNEKDGLLEKYRNPEQNAAFVEDWCSLTKKFLNALPYSLTSSQLSAISEIIWDLKRKVPMNRLLQGDVGCGKTVVAFLACMEVISSGYQAALMVPTELLAIQHYDHFINLLENMEDVDCKPSVALLTGSTSTKNARQIREGLRSGEIAFVIGTHSLIAEKVEFSALRIAVVDEQHRFGVIQRGRFTSKLYYNSGGSKLDETESTGASKENLNMAPHVLAMTATPIPRTLALALYGDMSLTQITDLPPGRKPIDTFTFEGNKAGFEKVYEMMQEELKSGGRVYVVYPIIDQSEQLPLLRSATADLEVISNRFEGIGCGLLHGRMKGDEKEEALRNFKLGETQILLATQVIEIGVDVPEASMMVVMNAERFGLAQLHQLRGRVGRGIRKSTCVLLCSTATGLNRLKALEKSSDGFHLANMDLLLRGPGDLLGKKQSGHLPEFPIARLEIDGNILQEAHFAALKILGKSHNLEEFPELRAELSMRQPLCLLGD